MTAINRWILALALVPAASAEIVDQRIEQFIGRYQALGLFNGSALVAEHGQVILKKGFGMANMEWNIPNAPDTKFRLGSVTRWDDESVVWRRSVFGRARAKANARSHDGDLT